ncbi:MAG: patatin-like phospholipase family protein [Candidatus Competibacter sp.]|nr:patatin-like phospholipase family protein [Candidatus Competibacter sp.]MDG4584762.1 patatin-like phospholipase family protein [Candidatus Competibacter sp.]
MRDRRAKRSLPCLLLALAALVVFGPVSPETTAAERPRIGLVLGGGGARGVAHVGVLRFLEEMRIPVDCVAGTSMGSIIGGLYASGMTPSDMDATLKRIDWPEVFTDGPPRADLPWRTKQEQRFLLTNAAIGVKGGKIQLPQGLLQGQNLLLLLQELSLPAAEIRDFDRLKIPYRAVATDIATGNPVVLSSGDLAKAMRASMSIPSALVPVELEGKLLVDGGVSDNLPIDVVRKLCRPDVVIAVDVGAPLAPTNELTSVLSITNQLTTILTVRNVEQQIKTLGSEDVLIVPDLKDLSSTDFDRSPEAVIIGYDAAQASRKALSRLSLSVADYQAYIAALPSIPDTDHPIVDFIRIKNSSRLSDQVIASQLRVQPGDRLDPRELNRNLNIVYGMGDFQEVDYSLIEEDGKTGLIVEARERYIGTDTLELGLSFGASLRGESLFALSAAYTLGQLNSLGGEWRTIGQVGGNIALSTDFYQPLDADQTYFIDPYASYQAYNLTLQDLSQYRVYRTNIGVVAGRNLEHWGRLSLGLRYGGGHNDLRIGQSNEDEGEFDEGGYSIRWGMDTLDNINFPTSGYYSDLNFYDSRTTLGASNDFSVLSLEAAKAFTWNKTSIIPRLRLAGRLSGELGIQDLFLLGGFLNLSGYQTNQLAGQYAALGELIAMYRLDNASAAFTIPIYAGGSLEVGGVWQDIGDINFSSLIPAGSLFLGADTPLGPFYLSGGWAKGGNTSLYILLGRQF